MKTALITGITGQDGSYLAEFLLDKNYEVHGLIRRNSTSDGTDRINHLLKLPTITLHYGDMTDFACLAQLIKDIQPDEIYNIAAQSHVRISMDVPQFTVQTNALGVLNVLEAYRFIGPKDEHGQVRFWMVASGNAMVCLL